MLINTVILFLRDALPIIIILAFLLLTTRKDDHGEHLLNNFNWLWFALPLSVFLTSILLIELDKIAQVYQDMGVEFLFSLEFLCIYTIILFHIFIKITAPKSILLTRSAMVIFILVFTVNATDFLVYLTGFWSQKELLLSISIGMVLGLGICASVGILGYFLLLLTMPKYQQKWVLLLLLLFGCGQLNQAINLLLQIDMLPTFNILWDSSFLIKENSELGHFFTALVGYDATPSGLHLFIYLSALFIPIAWYFFYQAAMTKVAGTGGNNE